MNLKDSTEGYMEGYGGKKGRNDIISKPKEIIKITFTCICVLATFYVYASFVCLGPEGARRRRQIIWKLSYRGL